MLLNIVFYPSISQVRKDYRNMARGIDLAETKSQTKARKRILNKLIDEAKNETFQSFVDKSNDTPGQFSNMMKILSNPFGKSVQTIDILEDEGKKQRPTRKRAHCYSTYSLLEDQARKPPRQSQGPQQLPTSILDHTKEARLEIALSKTSNLSTGLDGITCRWIKLIKHKQRELYSKYDSDYGGKWILPGVKNIFNQFKIRIVLEHMTRFTEADRWIPYVRDFLAERCFEISWGDTMLGAPSREKESQPPRDHL